MKRFLCGILALTMVLCILPVGGLAVKIDASRLKGGSSVSDLKAVPVTGTSARISWTGTDSSYRVYYSEYGGDVRYYKDATKSPFILKGLAPNTTYHIEVGTGTATTGLASAMLEMTDAERFRGNNYRWTYGKLYTVDASSYEEFWEDSSQKEIKNAKPGLFYGMGEDKNLAFVVKFTMSTTKVDKELDYTIVMTTPSRQIYTTDDTIEVPGDWKTVRWAFWLNNLIYDYTTYHEDVETGRYDFELYLEGEFAGDADLIIK